MNLWTTMVVEAVPAAASILHGVPHAGQFFEIPNWHLCRINNVLAHSQQKKIMFLLAALDA